MAALLSLVLLISCGGGESEDSSEAGEKLRSKIADGLELLHEKKYEEATSKVFELVLKNPKDAEALGVLSYIYLKSGRLDNAHEAAKRALAIDPNLFRPHVVIARVHFQKSGFNEALDLARKALILNPQSFEAYKLIGEVYLRKGLIKDAILVLKEGLRLDPENPEILNLLGSGYIKDKQYDHALSSLTAVQKIDANNPGAHFNLAVVYANLKDGNSAMRHIAKAEYLYAEQDDKLWLGKARDIRRVIARDFKLRPEDIN